MSDAPSKRRGTAGGSSVRPARSAVELAADPVARSPNRAPAAATDGRALPKLGPRARKRRLEILEAAERVFARAGYAGAKTEQIASEVGITQPAIYRYFPSKKALFMETLRFRQDELLLRYGEVLSSPIPAIDKLRRLVRVTSDLVEKHPNMGMLRVQAAAAVEDPSIRAGVLGTLRMLMGSHEALFRRAKEEGDVRPEIDTMAAAASLSGLALLFYVANDPDGEGAEMSDLDDQFAARFIESVAVQPLELDAVDAE